MSRDSFPRLRHWWTDDPEDPGRPQLKDPDAQRLMQAICPGGTGTDLGGTMSLNVRIEPAGLVLRLHQPFVSRPRLLAVQEVRRRLVASGLLVPMPRVWRGSTVLRYRDRLAELEPYIPNQKPPAEWSSFLWQFRAMGVLHRRLAQLDVAVPRPIFATYGPPSSLRRWLPVARQAVSDDRTATLVLERADRLIRRLGSWWIPATRLPTQLIHGDLRLGNVCLSPEGQTVHLDFGFMASRPRIHELAYSLAFIILSLGLHRVPDQFPWTRVQELVGEYEEAAGWCLTEDEYRALAPYLAAVPLFTIAAAGFAEQPVEHLHEWYPEFVDLTEWLLDHPEAVPRRPSGDPGKTYED